MDFSRWDNVLSKLVIVNQTLQGISLNTFNYSGLANNTDFIEFGWQVKNANLNGFDNYQWNAFWINVYNYLAVSMVYNYSCATDVFGSCRPIYSIREIGVDQPSLIVTVWNKKVLNITTLSSLLSLNDVENNLRFPPNKWPEDSRIHSAIVCASISCPNLQNHHFSSTPEYLEQNLTDSVKAFLSNLLKGSTVEGTGASQLLRVSAIFDFFPEDFQNSTKHPTNTKSISDFLFHYGPGPVRNYIKANPNPTLLYFTYNWDLNGDLSSVCKASRLCFPWWAFIVIGVGLLGIIGLLFVIYRKSKRRENYQMVN